MYKSRPFSNQFCTAINDEVVKQMFPIQRPFNV